MLAQALVKLRQPLQLILADAGGGDFRPKLDYSCEIIHRELRPPLRFELRKLAFELHFLAAQLRDAGIALIEHLVGEAALRSVLAHQRVALEFHVLKVAFGQHSAADAFVLEVHVGACLVDKVDGLVGQEAVGYIPLAHQHRLTAHLVGYLDAVVVLVVVRYAAQNFDAVLYRRLVDRDGLEAALKRGILLDMLAVLGKGRRADDLNFAAGERGFEDICGVHAALGVARADDIVHLVYDEDNIALLAYLLDQTLHAALKLAAELRTRDKRGEVEQEHLLILKLIGDVAHRDALRKPLCYSRFADARLADKAGVILLAAVQDLDNALQLLLAAYHAVELALTRTGGEVDAVIIKEFSLGLLRRLVAVLTRLTVVILRAVALRRRSRGAAEQAVEEGEGRGLAVVLGIVRAVVVHVHHVLNAAEGVHHISGDAVKVFVGDAHFVYNIIYGLNMQLAGALEAKPLVFCLPVFYLRDEHDSHIFAAAGTHCRLHCYLLRVVTASRRKPQGVTSAPW